MVTKIDFFHCQCLSDICFRLIFVINLFQSSVFIILEIFLHTFCPTLYYKSMVSRYQLIINLLFEFASLVHLIEIINYLFFNTSVHFWINIHDCSCLLNYFLIKLLPTSFEPSKAKQEFSTWTILTSLTKKLQFQSITKFKLFQFNFFCTISNDFPRTLLTLVVQVQKPNRKTAHNGPIFIQT